MDKFKPDSNSGAHGRLTRAHFIQSAMAGTYILLVFLALHSLLSQLTVATLGASAFIAFCSPSERASGPRFLIGGYGLGILCGVFCFQWAALFNDMFIIPGYIPASALAVFCAMLLMTVLDCEHPPSVALAVAITIDRRPIILGLAAMGCVLLLCCIKELAKKYMRNLY